MHHNKVAFRLKPYKMALWFNLFLSDIDSFVLIALYIQIMRHEKEKRSEQASSSLKRGITMKVIELPYGNGYRTVHVPEQNLKSVLYSQLTRYVPKASERELAESALSEPIGSQPLRQMAVGKQNVVIISSDHTRPVPSRLLMPLLLSEVRSGNPDAQITILVATGCHRSPTHEELVERYGEEIVSRETIRIHDCDAADLIDLGQLPSGNRLLLNAIAAKADLLVAEGFIEPHFFAGFSGGRKAVLPGVSGRNTVLYNHSAEKISDPNCRSGVIEHNPIHDDMCAAAERSGLKFILNVVINDRKEVIEAFAGSPEKAHAAGTSFLKGLCQCSCESADIVIATNGGAPLDQNIYQCVKGISTAEAICRNGGVIIMAARCNDGHGAQDFYETFANEQSNSAIMGEILKREALQTILTNGNRRFFSVYL